MGVEGRVLAIKPERKIFKMIQSLKIDFFLSD
jgi:hypothetical protein